MSSLLNTVRSKGGITAFALLATLAAVFFSPIQLPADEGEWLPEQLKDLDWPELRSRGLQLEADEIWDGEKGLLSAVVHLGGCSASFVSEQGLVVTNHHCGFGAINSASTLEHNYLADGFVSDSLAEEIPSPGMTVSFVTGYDDVTSHMHAAADAAGEDPAARHKAVQARQAELAKEGSSEFSSSIVVSYLEGRMWRRIHRTVLRDVRLVYAPPRAVGEYGGETDNWMWPRHTGDFSFFRAYVSPDGKPSTYAEENVPYNPPRHLQVSEEGADGQDLVMILGYPGRTSRYLTSMAVAARQQFFYPARLQLFSTLIAELEERASESDEAALRLASRIKSFANVEKNALGMIYGLARNEVVSNKEVEEADFQKWVDSDPGRQQRYGDLLQNMFELDQIAADRMPKDFVLDGLRRYSGSFSQARTASRRGDENTIDWMAAADPARDLLLGMAKDLPEGFRLRAFDAWQKNGGQDLAALAKALEPEFKAQSTFRDRQSGQRMQIGSLWIEAQELWRGKRFYPDANSTLRVSIATVKGYSPRDGVYHTPHTSVDGMLAKHTGSEEFTAPQAVFDAVAKNPDARNIKVCFLADGDTTGGNSGSPVVDGQGRLVGLNFDRVFENVAGDFGWNAERSRNVSVDIRYVLWLMRDVWPAPRLINEMGVGHDHGHQHDEEFGHSNMVPMLDVRFGLKKDDDGFDQAEKIEYRGGHLHLGPMHRFSIKELGVEEFVDGGFAVSIAVDDRDMFHDLTGANAGRPMAIWVDGAPVSVPLLMNAIPGRLLLQGGAKGFSEDEAKTLSQMLEYNLGELSASEAGTAGKSVNRGNPTLELRVVLTAGSSGYNSAETMEHDGEKLHLGKTFSFEVSKAYPTEVAGSRALGFEILDADSFFELTSDQIGNRLALLVDGKLITAPTIQSGIRGKGIISGGSNGLTKVEMEALMKHFNSVIGN